MEETTCIQCLICGQFIAGDKPENLERVCLECCDRMKQDCKKPADVPFIVFKASVPIAPIPCKQRYTVPKE